MHKSKIQELVEVYLRTHPAMRDDDMLLIANIWITKIGPLRAEEMTAKKFLSLFANSDLPNPETIRRLRQKLQETKPDLRGKRYRERHNIASQFPSFINQI